MGWKTFNDRLALVLLGLIPLLWVLGGPGDHRPAPGGDRGLIATWTLVVQYYFRKRPEG